MIKKWIKNKLQGYEVKLQESDLSHDTKLEQVKKVAIVGSGIAGLSAAYHLAEKGFIVTIFEKENYTGGKIGSWTFVSNGVELRTEHGFHGFFRQYYNLLAFLKKIGADKHLIPIDDYLLFFDKNKRVGFKDLKTTPIYNIWDLKRHEIFSWKFLLNPTTLPFVDLLRFDFKRTFQKYDNMSFEQFATKTRMPKKMKLVFNSFARAFFAEPEDMSMAELMKSFHFYYLSNDKGLIYDVLNRDFKFSFLQYIEKFLFENNATIHLNTPVSTIKIVNDKFSINQEEFDYCIMAADVKGAKTIMTNSTDFAIHKAYYEQLTSLKATNYYAVLRIWTDAFETDKKLPFFIFTDRLRCLDSVTLYHKMEEESATWSKENNGGIFELHSYAVPKDMSKEQTKIALLEEFHHYFPELKTATVHHEYYQYRDDFTAFHTGCYISRPTIHTPYKNFFVAGDWVKMDNCSMLMEAAYTSGTIAANHILSAEQIQTVSLKAIPNKGIFA